MEQHDATLDDNQPVLAIEDVDVHDETTLRWLSELANEVMGLEIRVSVLNTDQWSGVCRRYLGNKYKGAAPHLHVFVDPKVRSHLLVSPSTVLGVAQGSATMISEFVYGLLAAGGAPLAPVWRAGVHQYFAKEIAKEANLRFQNDYHPRESRLIDGLISVVQKEHGYDQRQWYQALKRRPGSVFTALARSAFAKEWIATAYTAPALRSHLPMKLSRDEWIKLITDPARTINDPIMLFTLSYLEGEVPVNGS